MGLISCIIIATAVACYFIGFLVGRQVERSKYEHYE